MKLTMKKMKGRPYVCTAFFLKINMEINKVFKFGAWFAQSITALKRLKLALALYKTAVPISSPEGGPGLSGKREGTWLVEKGGGGLYVHNAKITRELCQKQNKFTKEIWHHKIKQCSLNGIESL